MGRIIEELRCKLTEDEKHAKAQALARALHEHDKVEAAKKAASSDFAAKLKAKRAEVDELANDVRTGTEKREVECFEEPDLSQRVVMIVRSDTGEVVRSRPMRDDERQPKLFPLPGMRESRRDGAD